MSKSEFSIVGLARKTCLAAEAQGYTPELLNALAEHPTLFSQMLQVQLGYAEVKPIEPLIDLNADPFVPRGLAVERHQEGGFFKWDPKAVEPFIVGQQKKGIINGNKLLRTELEGRPVFNANLLDWLLEHPHLIPEDWKHDEQGRSRFIFFWGTIYRRLDGLLYVRCLAWDRDRWYCGTYWLGSDFDSRHPAAMRVS